MSDRYGRRPTSLTGTAIVAASAIGILLCRSADQFIALRLVQRFGAGVAIVNIGAIVGDLFDTHGAARMLGVVNLVQAVARLAAPFIGAALLAVSGWRSIFDVRLACCAFPGLLSLKLPETVLYASPALPNSGAGLRGLPHLFNRKPVRLCDRRGVNLHERVRTECGSVQRGARVERRSHRPCASSSTSAFSYSIPRTESSGLPAAPSVSRRACHWGSWH